MSLPKPDNLAILVRALGELHEKVLGQRPRALEPVSPQTLRGDVTIERLFYRRCRQVLEHGFTFIGEETGVHRVPGPETSRILVFVDPIDGTNLLKTGRRGYTSTFAIVIDEILVGGGTYLPHEPRTFSVWPGEEIPSRAATTPPRLVAVGSRDQAARPRFMRRLAKAGVQVEPMQSTARRFLELAEGRLAAAVKTVGWRDGFPRIWGVGAGLLACQQAGASIWFSASQRLLCAGSQEIAAMLSEDANDLCEMPLSAIYSSLSTNPSPTIRP